VKILLLLPLLAGLGGCIEHRASACFEGELRQASGVVNGQMVETLGAEQSVSGHLPQRLLIHAWLRDADGTLRFIAVDNRSPLAWWQRFPADILSQCWPGELRSQRPATISVRRPGLVEPTRLTALAHAAGYPAAHDQE
jgi:hypothetical protein